MLWENVVEKHSKGAKGDEGRYIPARSLRHQHRRKKVISGTGMVWQA